MLCPVCSQNASSSGSQWSIQCTPGRSGVRIGHRLGSRRLIDGRFDGRGHAIPLVVVVWSWRSLDSRRESRAVAGVDRRARAAPPNAPERV